MVTWTTEAAGRGLAKPRQDGEEVTSGLNPARGWDSVLTGALRKQSVLLLFPGENPGDKGCPDRTKARKVGQ